MDLGNLNTFPRELIQDILAFLDGHSLAICRSTCKALRGTIDASTSMVYAMTLAQFGLVAHHVPPASSDRLDLLKKYVGGWVEMKNSGYSEESFLNPSGNLWELFGDVLAQQSGLNLSLRRLPSNSLGVEEKTWDIPVEAGMRDFGTDPSQDLLVVIKEPRVQGAYAIHRIDLLTLSKGIRHPLAKEAVLHLTQLLTFFPMSYGVQVSGDHLGVIFHAREQHNYVVVWNWKTGVREMHLTGPEIGSFAFLSETHIAATFTYPHSENLALTLVNFRMADGSQPTEFMRYQGKIILDLPILHVLAVALIRCDPSPAWPVVDDSISFHDNPDQLIYTVAIWAQGGHQFTLVVHRATLLQYVDRGCTVIRWVDWGPRETRMLDAVNHTPPSPTFSCTSFGSVMVSLNRAGDMVNVFDFNRARVRRDVLAGAPDVNPNEKFRFPSDDEEQTAVCRQDTVIEGDEINPSFTSIVRTSLPFRARGIPVKLSPGEHWSVMRSQNSILLVTPAGREFKVLSW